MVRNQRHFLALSWDRTSLLFVLAQARGASVAIVAAGAHILDTEQTVTEQMAETLRDVLLSQRIKKVEVLIGLGRAQVDVVECALPPATDSELPTLVHNEVIRQHGDVHELSIIDYVALSDDPALPRTVTAAVLAPEVLTQITKVCDALGQPACSATLRVYSVASLLRRLQDQPELQGLVVHMQSADVDIAAYSHGHVRFSRTVRLSQSPNVDLPRTLLDEIRRTIAVAPPVEADGQNQPVPQHIYLFGDVQRQDELVAYLREKLQGQVTLLDPLAGIESNPMGMPVEQSQHFAALIGQIRDAADDKHAIDFLHPKQPQRTPSIWRRVAIAAAMFMFALFAGWWKLSSELATLDQANQQLAVRVKKAEETLQRLQRKQAIVQWLDQWQTNDVNWLDELRDLALRFPDGQDAVIGRLSCGPRSGATGATVEMQVQVRTQEIVAAMEGSLRDAHHAVQSNRISTVSSPYYTWQFQTRLDVQPRSPAEYADAAADATLPSHLTAHTNPSVEESAQRTADALHAVVRSAEGR